MQDTSPLQVNAKQFNNTAFLQLSRSVWGCKRKVKLPKEKKNTDGTSSNISDNDHKTAKMAKQLILAPEYDAIITYLNEVRTAVLMRGNPSFLPSVYVVRKDITEEIDAFLETAKAKLDNEMVPALVKVFAERKMEAQIRLDALATKLQIPDFAYAEADYPSSEDLAKCFKIQHRFISLIVPEGLPEGLREREEAKLKQSFEDAGEQIVSALREGLAKIIDHAVEVLSVNPGEKPKGFRDTAITNITEFVSTFKDKNLFNDEKLADMVKRAEEILTNVTPERLRDSRLARDEVAKKLAEVKPALDALVIERKGRAFKLDEE